jgi:hypothetical protein
VTGWESGRVMTRSRGAKLEHGRAEFVSLDVHWACFRRCYALFLAEICMERFQEAVKNGG